MRCRVLAGALSLAVLLGGCGVAGTRDVEPGIPTNNPTVVRHPVLTPTWQDRLFVLTVPRGWRVAHLDRANSNWSMVRLTGACYLSISVTGTASRDLSAGDIRRQYTQPADGYSWVVKRAGPRVIALLDQYGSQGHPPLRSTLGDAYIPLQDDSDVVVDIGAGIWPLRHHSCNAAEFVPRVSELQAAIQNVFAAARVLPRGVISR